jgi:hypothetical protein
MCMSMVALRTIDSIEMLTRAINDTAVSSYTVSLVIFKVSIIQLASSANIIYYSSKHAIHHHVFNLFINKVDNMFKFRFEMVRSIVLNDVNVTRLSSSTGHTPCSVLYVRPTKYRCLISVLQNSAATSYLSVSNPKYLLTSSIWLMSYT